MQTELIQFFFQRKVCFGQRWASRSRPWVQSSSSLTGNDSLQKAQLFLSALFFQEELVSLAKQSGLRVRKVETWFMHQRAQDHPRPTKKFCEAKYLGQLLLMETSNRPAHHHYPLPCPYPKQVPKDCCGWTTQESTKIFTAFLFPGYLLSYIKSSFISQKYMESRWREESPSLLIKRIMLSLVFTLEFNVVCT